MVHRGKSKVYGIGIDDINANIFIGGKTPTFYSRWRHMLMRCYDTKYQQRFPTYVGCIVCEDWHYLSKFKEWFDANFKEGLELDKDILVPGNKVYSPETCAFVPKYINYLQLDAATCVRELSPTNCRSRKSTAYQARVGTGNKSLSKVFPTYNEAHSWYVNTKRRVVKEYAISAFVANEINSDVYLALVRR